MTFSNPESYYQQENVDKDGDGLWSIEEMEASGMLEARTKVVENAVSERNALHDSFASATMQPSIILEPYQAEVVSASQLITAEELNTLYAELILHPLDSAQYAALYPLYMNKFNAFQAQQETHSEPQVATVNNESFFTTQPVENVAHTNNTDMSLSFSDYTQPEPSLVDRLNVQIGQDNYIASDNRPWILEPNIDPNAESVGLTYNVGGKTPKSLFDIFS